MGRSAEWQSHREGAQQHSGGLAYPPDRSRPFEELVEANSAPRVMTTLFAVANEDKPSARQGKGRPKPTHTHTHTTHHTIVK